MAMSQLRQIIHLVQFVYGGGNSESGSALSLVTGNVDMTLTNCTGGNANGVYLRRGIFVSGWDRTSSGPNMVLGDATLTLKNVHAPNIHATGDGAGVKGKVVIDVYGGGSTDTIDERFTTAIRITPLWVAIPMRP